MLELVERWRGYQVLRRLPGFEFTPVLLGKIASYVVADDSGASSVFAFMYRFGSVRGEAEPDEGRLHRMAVEVIKRAAAASESLPQVDRTFELQDGAWSEVRRPAWWIPYFP